MTAKTQSLVAFVHVANVERSIKFYADLGFEVKNTVVPNGRSAPIWAWLESETANLMVGLADIPVDASQQAVLFYLYFENIKQTRDVLLARGYSPSAINYPFHLPARRPRWLRADAGAAQLTSVANARRRAPVAASTHPVAPRPSIADARS